MTTWLSSVSPYTVVWHFGQNPNPSCHLSFGRSNTFLRTSSDIDWLMPMNIPLGYSRLAPGFSTYLRFWVSNARFFGSSSWRIANTSRHFCFLCCKFERIKNILIMSLFYFICLFIYFYRIIFVYLFIERIGLFLPVADQDKFPNQHHTTYIYIYICVCVCVCVCVSKMMEKPLPILKYL